MIEPIDVHGRPITTIVAELNAALRSMGVEPQEYGFSDSTVHDDGPRTAEDFRWIACFPVTGGSEGYYVHIELIDQKNDRRRLIALAKTWSWDNACALANAAARILGA